VILPVASILQDYQMASKPSKFLAAHPKDNKNKLQKIRTRTKLIYISEIYKK